MKKESKVSSCSVSATDVCDGQRKLFTAPYMSLNDYESAQHDLGVTNKFYQVGKFTNMKCTNNDCICLTAR